MALATEGAHTVPLFSYFLNIATKDAIILTMDEQMLQYIRTRRSVRVPDDMIRQELIGVGWSAPMVDEAFASLTPEPPKPAPPPTTPAQTPPPANPAPSEPPAAIPLSPAPTTPPIQPAPTTEQPTSAAQPAPGAKRILLVEDEKALATVLSLKLKNAGYDVTVVYNGDDALRMLGSSFFDLMLVDIMMPKRDGFSVLEELKKQNNQIPVFAMSNLGQEEDIARVKSMGVKEYIVKADASPTDILARVNSFLKQ